MRLRNLPPRGAVEGINFPSDVISNFRKSTLKALHDCGNFPLPRLVTAPSQHFSRDVQRRVEHIPPQSQKYLTLPKLNQRLVIRFIARSVYVSKFDSLRMTQRAGPGRLNRVSASIGGASAGVRLPCGVAA